jgi:hypothetical protein
MASDGAAPPPSPKVARIHMPFSGLEVGLLDVGRFVALTHGYAPACLLLSFVSPDFYREDDYLVATKQFSTARTTTSWPRSSSSTAQRGARA